MTPLFKKLNFKNEAEIVVINAPESFETELAALGETKIIREFGQTNDLKFLIAFVTQLEEIQPIADDIVANAMGDVVVWAAYPKKSSKRYRSEINRDSDWSALGQVGLEAVRQVAIDADWSALRFRRVEFIKSMKRESKRAISDEGKKRIAGE